MAKQTFAPGFRLSLLDAIILVIGVAAALVLSTIVWWWGFVVGFVLGHFFLFCNMVRMARPLELIWSAEFVALAVATVATDVPGWFMTTTISLIVTVIVVAIEVRKPRIMALAGGESIPGCPLGGNRGQQQRVMVMLNAGRNEALQLRVAMAGDMERGRNEGLVQSWVTGVLCGRSRVFAQATRMSHFRPHKE
jgi:hypothetical protein